MADPTQGPFDMFGLSKDLFSAQQRLLPSAHNYERLAEAARMVTQAQIAFGQALMRANAVLLGANLAPAEAQAEREQRPSVAARQPELAA